MDNINPETGEILDVDDIEIEIEAGEQRPLLPDGEYEAKFLRQEPAKMHMFKGTRRLFVHFEIVEPGAHNGKRVFGSWPLGDIVVENGKRRLVAKKHGNLAAMLKRLFGKTARISRASLSSLKGSVVKIRTRTVTRDYRQRPKAEYERYSVVDDIVAICAGTAQP
jgi:hypothetical protein